MLIDGHGRNINYLRIAVTDKCNLRCHYCMPEHGMVFKPKSELLSYEEIIRIVELLAQKGINKIRITGGEPFLRRDIMLLLTALSKIKGVDKIVVTTNGIFTSKYLDGLIGLGINEINLSLDALDPVVFRRITKRDDFEAVRHFMEEAIAKKVMLKINCVVLKEENIDQIIPLIQLTKQHDLSVRLIEEMPFNGAQEYNPILEWNYIKILEHIERYFGNVKKMVDPKSSTSLNYNIPGHVGSFGIIPAYTRSFCGTCNRIRITPDGKLKTCLYDNGIFDLKALIRAGATDTEIVTAIQDAILHKYKDGFEAEHSRSKRNPVTESMSIIGG